MRRLVRSFVGCRAGTLLRFWYTTHHLLHVLTAAGPGLLLADLAGHLLAHATEIQSEFSGE